MTLNGHNKKAGNQTKTAKLNWTKSVGNHSKKSFLTDTHTVTHKNTLVEYIFKTCEISFSSVPKQERYVQAFHTDIIVKK